MTFSRECGRRPSWRIGTIAVAAMIVMACADGARAAKTATATTRAASSWTDPFYPYRASIELQRPSSGRIEIDLSAEDLLKALQQVAVDELRLETLAFDTAVLVDPTSGKTVGRFELAQGAPIEIDGHFEKLAAGKGSPWTGFVPDEMRIEPFDTNGTSSRAVVITKSEIANTRLAQPLELKRGELYLLDYWVRSDPIDNNISIDLYDPKRWYFAHLPRSYVAGLTPQNKWTRVLVLQRANVEQAELRIGTAFTGTCAVAAMKLSPVRWRLVADLPAKTDRLELYCVTLGGHQMTQPTEANLASQPAPAARKVPVRAIRGERADLNPGGALVRGDIATAWTIPPAHPLRADHLSRTVPAATGSTHAVHLEAGGTATVLVAIDTRTPLARVIDAQCDLPLEARFERLVEVPIHDGPFPKGKFVESRLDALLPVDSDVIPPSSSGIHVVAVTLVAAADAKPGAHAGHIRLDVQTQEPARQTIDIPIRVTISPLALKPMRHFGAVFGMGYFDRRMLKDENYIRDSVTTADFHGMEKTTPALREKYLQRLVESYVIPQHLMSENIGCEVVDQGKGKAPLLKNWNFTGLDHAIDRWLLKHDVPWLMVHHSNGDVMPSLRLPNGSEYTIKPVEPDGKAVRLPKEEYYRLVGDYFEAIAAHMAGRGVLDRAVYVIDESSPESYETIYDYTQAVKSRPHGKGIRFAHTAYKTSTYTRRLPDGSLVLDHALDMPMPNNDEHFNFFEPEYMARMKRPGKTPWVYYVETTHHSLDYAGLSTVVTPLKLKHFGADGWYCWAAFLWSWPVKYDTEVGLRYAIGPVVNPWLTTFYHHGPGGLSFFYPPDPRGPTTQPVDRVVPAYRLALIRDGIRMRALLEALERGSDDSGRAIDVDPEKLKAAKAELARLWAANPVQWYISHRGLQRAEELLWDAVKRPTNAGQ